ncbi:hypothetical protein T11_1145 [Trichinella zimbabwensis]|uniref:Uncharacterized protein n=1 Tax=Trichinella zimbabwensis TaxID=268475 RepID=A0A0V1I0F0_9BILA|nr:hypothetical protein T11_1145 [Trichinella zimbabwensis]
MATVEFEGIFDQMRLTSRLPDEITSEAYLNVDSRVATTAVLNDSQIVELYSTGDDSESEDADADNQNIEIPSSSEALVMSDQLRSFVDDFCHHKRTLRSRTMETSSKNLFLLKRQLSINSTVFRSPFLNFKFNVYQPFETYLVCQPSLSVGHIVVLRWCAPLKQQGFNDFPITKGRNSSVPFALQQNNMVNICFAFSPSSFPHPTD